VDCASAELSGLNYQNGRKNQWHTARVRANGKTERESNFGLNILETPFRGYDPALGRFHQPDAITDLLPGISSYAFGFNNPVYFNDPSGLVGEGGSGQDKGVIPPGKRTVDKYGGWVWSAGAMANTAKPSSGGFPPIPDPLKVGGGGEGRSLEVPQAPGSNQKGEEIDPYDFDQLSDNPDYQGLDIKLLRNIASFTGTKYKNDIIAGNALEIAFGDWMSLMRNSTNYDNFVRPQSVRPDFTTPSSFLNWRTGDYWYFPKGAWYEVKATQYDLDPGSFRKQIAGEMEALSREKSFFGTPGRGMWALSFTMVLPHGISAEGLADIAREYKINLFVSYSFLNKKTGGVVFSTPRLLAGDPKALKSRRKPPFPRPEGVQFNWQKANVFK
jgi:RHS repeat-associated protein